MLSFFLLAICLQYAAPALCLTLDLVYAGELWKDPEKLSIKRLLALLVLWTGAAVTFWMSEAIRAEGG